MLLIDWWFFVALTVGAIIVFTSIYGFRLTKKIANRPLRFAVRLICVPLGAITSLLMLLLTAASGSVSHSPPIYSPSGNLAARIENADEGATGGSTSVELYWAHGFEKKDVYLGGWKSVEPSDIQWVGNTELTIRYASGYNADTLHCTSTASVKVSCIPK
jgi:hypothetical protein